MYVSVLAHTDPKLAGGITWGKFISLELFLKCIQKKSVLEKKDKMGIKF